ncbi:MAG: hypothetical protein Q9169_008685, partial [Polycauliona sp. 2 TL-2023]
LHPPSKPPPPYPNKSNPPPPHPDNNQIISLSPLLDPTSPAAHTASASLLSAFRTSGFLYLTDISPLIPPSTIASVFKHSAHFFALPSSKKEAVACRTASSNRGYIRQGREKVSVALTADDVERERAEGGEDMKETYEIGREGAEGNPQPWPESSGDDEEGGFKETMQDFFRRCQRLHIMVMRGIAIGLGLEFTFFDGLVGVGDNNLRLLHYPAVEKGGFEGKGGEKRMRAGAHSDYGSVTFLFQDGKEGGLQVERGEEGGGGWMDVGVREGMVVVNAGDVMARWSNDLIRSTKHRVVEPPSPSPSTNTYHPPRYSIAYFCNPDYEAWIDALPGTWENVEGGKKYEGINAQDYLFGRLNATVGAM